MVFEARDIDKTKLPTNHQIIEYFLYLKKNGTSTMKKNLNLSSYLKIVIKVLSELWEKTRIPIITNRAIRSMLKCLLDKRQEIIKKHKKYVESEWSMLFKISKCKCAFELECNCPGFNKIPPNIKHFYVDQSGPRILNLPQLEDFDRDVYMVDIESSIGTSHPSTYTDEYAPSDEYESEAADAVMSPIQQQPKTSDISLQNYSLALDRTGISDRYGSFLATTFIIDLKLSIAAKSKPDCQDDCARMFDYLDGLIIDKNKIKREREKFRAESTSVSNSDKMLKCISYDGKKDKTLKKNIVENKVRLHEITEEHITIVKEPESTFVGYATPVNGSGKEIQKAIVNFLHSECYSLNQLVAINCDGTAVNTGFKAGVNSYMERFLQRPLQWNVCLFHFNELPLKALLTHLYGKQVGPGIWPGEFGSQIVTCEQYPVASDFEAISMGHMPDNVDDWIIRGDQKYLFNMVVAVNNGSCDQLLAAQKPGPVSTARWLSTACRILRLYISKRNPSENLRILAAFIVKVYAPFWFLVKSQPQCIHGSRHVFKYIVWIRKLPVNIQMIIRPVIEHNSYYLHPENILLAMVTDLDQTVRSRGYDAIRGARDNPPVKIREFRVPKNQIDFDSDTYTEIINWNNIELTEPPCLRFCTDEQLLHYQYSSDEIIQIPDFPCHTQTTERFVRVVNESASKVTDEKRMGYIFSKIRSRERYSKMDSRQDLA